MFSKIVNYCKACYDELAHKTTWPTRAELTHSAMIVLSASLVIALVVFGMDSLFKFVMSTIYPR
ncbi:MAG: preprotein translocase subunit SecE [Alloprevotella tannerae]|uniref:preprotein translocase subunit SecE n=1 Tax=Segatella salivae TaxID=228604 RepID=UPI00040733E9|nr:preprotein translocase subunit SecE [Segatella salivae]MBF0957529.1 preprotein translocase subunit SecE [Alloprevotella tannerae]MBF1410098.1 preprotein translocase subunit SecE [Prevotella histicola]MBF1571154.1 preprotein translocase subunit SecE [Prevotella sp.]MBF1522399.1 preprotein translocase subunit SecE [Segatella salivae]MBF1532476.1 preprotein translocase subunit SecE [Segatella salivae]